MTMWNSWRQLTKQLSELHSGGFAYFVLDKLGDKVAGPFVKEGDARVYMLSLPDDEFQITQEYWGPSVDMFECSNEGKLDAPKGSLARILSRLVHRRFDLRSFSFSLFDTSTQEKRTEDLSSVPSKVAEISLRFCALVGSQPFADQRISRARTPRV